MSHLVLLQVGDIARPLEFQTLTGESLQCLSSFAEVRMEHFNVKQYGYHPEYGVTLAEFIIDWGTMQFPGPRSGELGIAGTREPLELAVKRLQLQYELATETTCTLVRHEGRITRCSFKPKGEWLESPIDLVWSTIDPPKQDILV